MCSLLLLLLLIHSSAFCLSSTPSTCDHIKVTIQQPTTITKKKESGIFIKRKIYYDVNEHIKSMNEWSRMKERTERKREKKRWKTKGKEDVFHSVCYMDLLETAYCRRHRMQPRLSEYCKVESCSASDKVKRNTIDYGNGWIWGLCACAFVWIYIFHI